jgi:hypothetical protein
MTGGLFFVLFDLIARFYFRCMAIDLKECINIIERGEWFGPLRFMTADVKKGSGGRVVEIHKARIARKHHPIGSAISNDNDHSPVVNSASKNPNHNANFTRNIELPNKQIRKVHPILITHINNQPVV